MTKIFRNPLFFISLLMYMLIINGCGSSNRGTNCESLQTLTPTPTSSFKPVPLPVGVDSDWNPQNGWSMWYDPDWWGNAPGWVKVNDGYIGSGIESTRINENHLVNEYYGKDYSLSVQVKLKNKSVYQGSEYGILGRYRDENHWYAAILQIYRNPDRVDLCIAKKYGNSGSYHGHKTVARSLLPEVYYNLKMVVSGKNICASFSGGTNTYTVNWTDDLFDEDIPEGKIGLIVNRLESVVFDNFQFSSSGI